VARQMQVDKMALYGIEAEWIGIRAGKFRVSPEGVGRRETHRDRRATIRLSLLI